MWKKPSIKKLIFSDKNLTIESALYASGAHRGQLTYNNKKR